MITSKLVSAACSRPAANVAATVGSMRCARSPSRSSAASSGSSSTISTRMGDAPHRDAGEAVPASPNYDSREVTLRFEEPTASLNVPLYDPRLVQPMREELTRIGFQELRTPAEVDAALAPAPDTTLVVVTSESGSAARNARPAATLAIQHAHRPQRLLTV